MSNLYELSQLDADDSPPEATAAEDRDNSGFESDVTFGDEVAVKEPAAAPESKRPYDATDARAKTYDKRKTIAHGMMDTALISANASQLKFVIQYYRGRDAATLAVLVTLITLSLVIQIAVGIALIFRHRKRNKTIQKVNTSGFNISVDDFIISGVFLVITLNIFISAFSTELPRN